eukprot:3386360-Lingulodinium_polyedra.AAC.1
MEAIVGSQGYPDASVSGNEPVLPLSQGAGQVPAQAVASAVVGGSSGPFAKATAMAAPADWPADT